MEKVFGKYRIATRIATRSPNPAYLARSATASQWSHVVKVYATRPLRSQEEEEAFRQHIAGLRQLDHPYILPITDCGIEEGIPFCVTSYLPNGSLCSRLKSEVLTSSSIQEIATL